MLKLSFNISISNANTLFLWDYKINMINGNTISGLALHIYLHNYYKKYVPHINKPNIILYLITKLE